MKTECMWIVGDDKAGEMMMTIDNMLKISREFFTENGDFENDAKHG